MITDCQNVPLPVFTCGKVIGCEIVDGAVPNGSVKLLKVCLDAKNEAPVPGQFYMLHAVRSDVLLSRPISVYHSEKKLTVLLKFGSLFCLREREL